MFFNAPPPKPRNPLATAFPVVGTGFPPTVPSLKRCSYRGSYQVFLARKGVPTRVPTRVPTNSTKHVKTGNHYAHTIDMNISIKKVIVLPE